MTDTPGLLSSSENRTYGTTWDSEPAAGPERDNLGFDGEPAGVEKNKSGRKTKYDEGKYF